MSERKMTAWERVTTPLERDVRKREEREEAPKVRLAAPIKDGFLLGVGFTIWTVVLGFVSGLVVVLFFAGGGF